MLCALLGGIVALNVLSLSLTAGSGRTSLQIDELKTRGLLAAGADRRAALGGQGGGGGRQARSRQSGSEGDHLPERRDANAARLAHLLATDSFLLAPSQPSSYRAPGTSYAPVPTTATGPTTTTTTAPVTPTTDADDADGAPEHDDPDHRHGRRRLGRRPVRQRRLERVLGGRYRRRGALGRAPAMRLIDRRLGLLFCGFLLVFSFAIARAFWLQGVRGGDLRAEARSQQVTQVTIPGQRGRVLDRNGKVLAASEDAADVIATPYQVVNPGQTALRLAQIARGAHQRPARQALGSQLRLRVPRAEGRPDRAARVKKLDIAGISTVPTSRRLYPQGELASQVIGAVGTDNQGLTGLEHSENAVLRRRRTASRTSSTTPSADRFAWRR